MLSLKNNEYGSWLTNAQEALLSNDPLVGHLWGRANDPLEPLLGLQKRLVGRGSKGVQDPKHKTFTDYQLVTSFFLSNIRISHVHGVPLE